MVSPFVRCGGLKRHRPRLRDRHPTLRAFSKRFASLASTVRELSGLSVTPSANSSGQSSNCLGERGVSSPESPSFARLAR
jgi:hypothetical protein